MGKLQSPEEGLPFRPGRIPTAQRKKKVPRVLQLIDTGGPGGAETVLTHLAVGLQAQGWACQWTLEEGLRETYEHIAKGRGTV